MKISYHADAEHYFDLIKHLPAPVWLDSCCAPQNPGGRHDIISAAPVRLLTSRGKVTCEERLDRNLALTQVTTHQANPFSLVGELLQEHAQKTITPHPELPFTGGVIGYWGYELNSPLPTSPKSPIETPANMRAGLYLWCLNLDHHLKRATLHFCSDCPQWLKDAVESSLTQQNKKTIKTLKINEFKKKLNKLNYISAVEKIQNYIRAGDCYQVNFAQQFEAEYKGDPLAAYKLLRQQFPSPYSAYLPTENGAIISLSPEQFLSCKNGAVSTKPIKGTSPRSPAPDIDKQNAHNLVHSDKDRAENLMIVDLLRNDLSKVCQKHSVKTQALFKLESYTNVHHLVSTVTGQLRPEQFSTQLLSAAFPGGSITGAPKLRAMQIISELEPEDRSIYCGSIGYINFNGDMDTNIAIRTLLAHNHKLLCWGGGGITIDSQPEQEYQETLDKVGPLMSALEQAFLKN